MILFMTMYIVIALIGLMLVANQKKKVFITAGDLPFSTDSEHAYLALCFLVMFLLCALRDPSVGVDTKTYVQTFLNKNVLESEIDGANKFEIGYRLYISALRLITNNKQAYVFITALITFIGTYSFVEKNCNGSYCLSIMIFTPFLYYSYFSALRQSLAIAIAINSFHYICERKWIKATALILIGGSFHYTALILLAFIPLSITKWTKRKVIIALLMSAAGAALFEPLMNLVLRFFPIYMRYWESGMMRPEQLSNGTFSMLVIMMCTFSIINLVKNGNVIEDQQARSKYICALAGSIFCVFISILGIRQGIFSRVTRYFIPFTMVLTASTYKYYANKFKFLFCLGVALIMGSYFYVKLRGNMYQIIPYKFFFGST